MPRAFSDFIRAEAASAGLDIARDDAAACWVLWTSQRHESGEQEYASYRVTDAWAYWSSADPLGSETQAEDAARYAVASAVWKWCEGREFGQEETDDD